METDLPALLFDKVLGLLCESITLKDSSATVNWYFHLTLSEGQGFSLMSHSNRDVSIQRRNSKGNVRIFFNVPKLTL